MPYLDSTPENTGPEGVFMQFPVSGQYLGPLTEALMRGESSLSPAERELIAAYTSGLNACQLCYNSHAAAAEALGIDPDLLEGLIKDLEAASIDGKTKALLRYVRKLTLEPAKMTEDDARAFLAAGWDEDALYHAVAVSGLFGLFNRMSDAYGLRLPAHARAEVGGYLARHGYASEHSHHG